MKGFICMTSKNHCFSSNHIFKLYHLGYIYMNWTVETLDTTVDAEIEELPPALRSRLVRLMETIESVGLEKLREPHVKHLSGKLWELRVKASEGIARDGNGAESRYPPCFR